MTSTAKDEELNKVRDERLKLRTHRTKKLKEGTYIEWLKKEHGVMDEDELILDKEFFNDIVREIEKNREKMIVYDYHYRRQDLYDWQLMQRRKANMRLLAEAKRKKQEMNKTAG